MGRLAVERLRVEELEGDIAVECGVVGGIDDTHPTGPDGLVDAVATQPLADHDS